MSSRYYVYTSFNILLKVVKKLVYIYIRCSPYRSIIKVYRITSKEIFRRGIMDDPILLLYRMITNSPPSIERASISYRNCRDNILRTPTGNGTVTLHRMLRYNMLCLFIYADMCQLLWICFLQRRRGLQFEYGCLPAFRRPVSRLLFRFLQHKLPAASPLRSLLLDDPYAPGCLSLYIVLLTCWPPDLLSYLYIPHAHDISSRSTCVKSYIHQPVLYWDLSFCREPSPYYTNAI